MKSGNIEQFKQFSQFTSLQEFNASNKKALEIHGHHFTKSERIAFDVLTRFSVKVLGVCNARICKLVQACQNTKGGISRSTFERMLRKAKSLGIISIIHTLRETGGFSHSVYIFNRFDTPNNEQLTERKNSKKPNLPTIVQAFKQTVFRYKQKRIKSSFTAYFYGTLSSMLTIEKRKIVAENTQWGQWLKS